MDAVHPIRHSGQSSIKKFPPASPTYGQQARPGQVAVQSGYGGANVSSLEKTYDPDDRLKWRELYTLKKSMHYWVDDGAHMMDIWVEAATGRTFVCYFHI
jgi:hypothetical protein